MKLLIGLISLFVLAAEPAFIDFTQPITGLDGKPISQGDPKSPIVLTLGDVATTALETMIDEDKSATGETKFRLDELARKIYQNKHAVLSVEEVALIKTRIGKLFSPITVGAAWRLLDPSLREKPPAK